MRVHNPLLFPRYTCCRSIIVLGKVEDGTLVYLLRDIWGVKGDPFHALSSVSYVSQALSGPTSPHIVAVNYQPRTCQNHFIVPQARLPTAHSLPFLIPQPPFIYLYLRQS